MNEPSSWLVSFYQKLKELGMIISSGDSTRVFSQFFASFEDLEARFNVIFQFDFRRHSQIILLLTVISLQKSQKSIFDNQTKLNFFHDNQQVYTFSFRKIFFKQVGNNPMLSLLTSVRLTILCDSNIIIIRSMMNIFRSKQCKQTIKLLQTYGFSSSDFIDYRIGNAANQIVSKGLLAQFKKIIKQQKMTHLKLLKASLLVLHILQISQKIEQNPHLQEIIRELQVRTKATLHYSRKALNCQRRAGSYGDKKQGGKQLEFDNTAKQICDHQSEIPENVQQNSVSYLLGKLVQPLLHIQEKVLHCHELIYKPKAKMNFHICWATLNLLKKFAELGHVIEDIGRYYQEYVIAMVSTIRVLSLDIRMLYRRVADYLNVKCRELQTIITINNQSPFQSSSSHNLKQVVMLLQELQRINDNVRLIYCNKYFSELLVLNHIYMPKIFSTDQENLQIIFSYLEFKSKSPQKHCRTAKSASIIKLFKTDLMESVEMV